MSKKWPGKAFAVAVMALVAAGCADGRSEVARTAHVAAAAPTDTIIVFKTPTCGCCNAWVDHVVASGFAVETHDLDDLAATKQQLRVPPGRISCHTATVGGYTLEGHVPADLIRRMLDEQPRFRGLAVPGMPMGSPGMEGPITQSYEVLSFDDDGRTEVYARR